MTTAYCDFAYYSGTYLGSTILEVDFPRLTLRASAVVDRLTFNRAAVETDLALIDAIKMAVCAVADKMKVLVDDGDSTAIKSESEGRYSVTYSEDSDKLLSASQQYQLEAETYLASTGLMFRGFTQDEA